MPARVLLVFAAVMVCISSALASSILPAEGAPSLQSEPDLEATVEALQTEVADQEARIRALEVMVGVMLMTGSDGSDVGNPSAADGLDIRSPRAADDFVITGEVVLPTYASRAGQNEIGSWCWGNGEYSDLKGGASVTITNGLGIMIGSGTLGGGFVTEAGCAMGFSVPVSRSDRYEIQVTDLPAAEYSFDRLDELDWEIRITVTRLATTFSWRGVSRQTWLRSSATGWWQADSPRGARTDVDSSGRRE
jgi:hypothetical protein